MGLKKIENIRFEKKVTKRASVITPSNSAQKLTRVILYWLTLLLLAVQALNALLGEEKKSLLNAKCRDRIYAPATETLTNTKQKLSAPC